MPRYKPKHNIIVIHFNPTDPFTYYDILGKGVNDTKLLDMKTIKENKELYALIHPHVPPPHPIPIIDSIQIEIQPNAPYINNNLSLAPPDTLDDQDFREFCVTNEGGNTNFNELIQYI